MARKRRKVRAGGTARLVRRRRRVVKQGQETEEVVGPEQSPLDRAAAEHGRHGVFVDEATGWFWCRPCSLFLSRIILVPAWPHQIDVDAVHAAAAAEGAPPMAVAALPVHHHVASREHVSAVEALLGVDEFCPAEINGRPVILDHHAIYPAAMFGPGAMLFDETVKLLIAPDVCGGVRLCPRHRYTVVRLSRPESTSAIPQRAALSMAQLAQQHFVQKPTLQPCLKHSKAKIMTPSGTVFAPARSETEKWLDNVNTCIVKEVRALQDMNNALCEWAMPAEDKA